MVQQTAIVTGGCRWHRRCIGTSPRQQGRQRDACGCRCQGLGQSRGRGSGGNASRILQIAADVSRAEETENYVRKTIEAFGQIDYFANNAGIEGRQALIEDLSVEDFDRVYAINVRGVFLGLRAVLPQMKKQGFGSIVNTASLARDLGSTQTGRVHHVEARRCRPHQGRCGRSSSAWRAVNAVLPGVINTDMMRRIDDATGDAVLARKSNAAGNPMGRYGEPDEVAAVVEFLFSKEAAFVTSSLYTVDGGAVWQ